MNEYTVSAVCPYCKMKNLVRDVKAHGIYHEPETLRCDIDQGGCDRVFVFKICLSVDVSTYEIDEREDSI